MLCSPCLRLLWIGVGREGVFRKTSAAFDWVSPRSLLYKLKSMDDERQFLFIVSQFFSDRRQRVRLDGKVSVSVDVV